MNQIILHTITLDELITTIDKLLTKKLKPQQIQKQQFQYLSRKEVASLIKITLPTLHDWTKLGWLKSYKIGSRVLYKEEEVRNAIENLKPQKHKKGHI